MTRCTYLFRAGRRERLALPGQIPSEFFYGYPQLAAQGTDVRLIEDAEVGMVPPLPPLAQLVNKLSFILGDLPVGMALSLAMANGGKRLDDAGTVIATTNGMGMALAIGKAVGLVKAPVVLLAMGLLPSRSSRLQTWLYSRLLRHLHLACISKSEQKFLQRIFPDHPVHYVQFGVDASFWRPDSSIAKTHGYALAIGNDRNRDWATLVAAWSLDLPQLKIVTSLPVPPAPPNVEVIRGDWRTRVLTDEDVRDLYQGASFVIVPVRDTIQPSGQSVCLQAMSCGKPVILSDIAGMWDRDLMVDGRSVLLTPPGDPVNLAERVHRLCAEPALAERLGAEARRVIETDLNTDIMARSLLNLVEGLHD